MLYLFSAEMGSMSTDRLIPISAAARCWIGLRRVYFGVLIEDVLAKTDISGLSDMDMY